TGGGGRGLRRVLRPAFGDHADGRPPQHRRAAHAVQGACAGGRADRHADRRSLAHPRAACLPGAISDPDPVRRAGRRRPVAGGAGAYRRARGGGAQRAYAAGRGAGLRAGRAPGLSVLRQLPAGALRRRPGRVRRPAGRRRGGARPACRAAAGRRPAHHRRHPRTEPTRAGHPGRTGSRCMTPILFIDRDGTLIEEPEDFQIDAYEKLRFVEGVIPALLKLRDAGYQFVMVSNQDGLGTDKYPQETFDGPHNLMMQVFESQGIRFRDVLIDCSWSHENKPTRKPGIGLVLPYIQDRSIDWKRSAMVGDRPTDNEFAANLGIRAFQLKPPQFGGEWDWSGIAHELADAPRRAVVQRNTKETKIRVAVDLDRVADPKIHTGLPFYDHMLEQIGKHGGFALEIEAEGDLHIDEHHTIEDTALALGQALREALGDKRGIGRYGFT